METKVAKKNGEGALPEPRAAASRSEPRPEGPSAPEVQKKGTNNNLNFIQTLGVISLKENQRDGSIFFSAVQSLSRVQLFATP